MSNESCQKGEIGMTTWGVRFKFFAGGMEREGFPILSFQLLETKFYSMKMNEVIVLHL